MTRNLRMCRDLSPAVYITISLFPGRAGLELPPSSALALEQGGRDIFHLEYLDGLIDYSGWLSLILYYYSYIIYLFWSFLLLFSWLLLFSSSNWIVIIHVKAGAGNKPPSCSRPTKRSPKLSVIPATPKSTWLGFRSVFPFRHEGAEHFPFVPSSVMLHSSSLDSWICLDPNPNPNSNPPINNTDR